MNQGKQFPSLVKPLGVVAPPIEGPFTNNLGSPARHLKLASVFKHIHVHIVEKLVCHCTAGTRSLWENHHTMIRKNSFLDLIYGSSFWPLHSWWHAVLHPWGHATEPACWASCVRPAMSPKGPPSARWQWNWIQTVLGLQGTPHMSFPGYVSTSHLLL